MNTFSRLFALLVLLTVAGSEAQVATAPAADLSLNGPAASRPAPNTLVLGSGTSVSYDSNALNSQPPTPNVEYTIYPQIGINLARHRWDALINFVPGFSYNSANLPQYKGVSLTSGITLQYRASQRLTLNFLNNLVSSTNPFASLTAGYQPGQGGAASPAGPALNYLPRTNENAAADMAYNLNAKTSLVASASYNYLDYQHDPNIPDAAQPFQQSTSTQVSMGLRRSSSPRYQASVLYGAQLFDAGQGLIKTVGQSVQYSLQYSPTASLRISAMAGPEYVQNTYGGVLGIGGGSNVFNQRTAGWTWTGSAGVAWTHGVSQLSASISKQLATGTQYQGNVEETFLNADFHRQLPGRTALTLFGGYNINKPVFLAQSAPRFSNNYLSTGAALSKTIGRYWNVGVAYWYLQQNSPQSVGSLYSGDHNRVAISLSYSITKPLRK
jgi:hypothetical protein